MDHGRFDDLSAGSLPVFSRRRVFGLILAGVLMVAGTRGAAACRAGGALCSGDGQCCSGRCFANGTCSCRKPSGRSVGCKSAGRCKTVACTDTGRCVFRAEASGDALWRWQRLQRLGSCVDTCRDGIEDGDETDVDCGGTCLPCGEEFATCKTATDCRERHLL
jgi:hypothetical protein